MSMKVEVRDKVLELGRNRVMASYLDLLISFKSRDRVRFVQ